jgi:SAM-dependent methyltransferase/uncharacterized protein YbaR (Trm112 family)
MNLVCPRDYSALETEGPRLICSDGHEYPIIDGIPVLLLDEREAPWTAISQRLAREGRQEWTPPAPWTPDSPDAIHPHVKSLIAAAGGYLYQELAEKLTAYPIPALRLPDADSAKFLDIGCNWGRWSIAAARKGYSVTGLDPDINVIMTARDVARQLGVQPQLVVADARYLPFAARSFDICFSYSVIQHFSKDNARAAIQEIGRVLQAGGQSLVQMPNRYGLRSFYHQARRGFAEGKDFDVRYWTPGELLATFNKAVGNSRLSVDGFFGLGIQPTDLPLMPLKRKTVIVASEFLRSLNKFVRPLLNVADSIYVHSVKSSSAASAAICSDS